MANKLFIDTNIFLDLLLNRGAFGQHAHNLFSICIDQKKELFTSVSCIQTMIYVLQKSGCSRTVVKNSVSRINNLVAMANTTEEDITNAIQSEIKDLEDAILYHTALSNNCDAMITRNVKDFPKDNELIKVLKPEEF